MQNKKKTHEFVWNKNKTENTTNNKTGSCSHMVSLNRIYVIFTSEKKFNNF